MVKSSSDEPASEAETGCLHGAAPVVFESVGKEALSRAAALFRACGDPERLRILERLMQAERCVSELATESGEGLSTVSQRLRLLWAEGLVNRRREGKHVYYGLLDQHVVDLIRSALEHALEPGRYDRHSPRNDRHSPRHGGPGA